MSPLNTEWVPLLRKVFFFSGFSEEELAGLLQVMSLLSLPKGAVLFRRGDPGDALYLISSGRVRVVEDERPGEKVLAYLGRGDSLGEMSLLTGEPRPHTAVVDATAEVLVLYRKDFDPLLRTLPSMAVHIARVLSRRLVAQAAPGPSASASPGKLYALSSRLPVEENVLFTVNLAVSLAEQTRRKVLVVDVLDRESGVFARAVGLNPVRVGETSLRQEDLQSPTVVQRLTVYHPSGLEFLSLPLPLMEGKLLGSIYPFLSLLRENYDIVLVVLPGAATACGKAVLEEADRLIYVERDPFTGEDAEALAVFQPLVPPPKLWRAQLSPGAARGAGPTDGRFVFPWPPSLTRDYAEKKSPFLTQAPHVQRQMDRLARHLGDLRIGFAMGSGAAYGYTLIGMLKVLERNGIYPDVLAGTSMGALIGSFYAQGRTPAELEEIALSITKKKLLSLADFTLPWQGLLLGRQMLKFLKSVLGDASFEDLPTPFQCVATNIVTGEEVVLKQGKVAEAVRASLSLPFFFQPAFHEGRFLVDGGLTNPAPTSVIAAMGADVLITVNLTTKPVAKRLPGRRDWRRRSSSYWKGPNILEVLMKTIYTMQFEIAEARAEIAHVALVPDLAEFTWAELHRAADIIKVGEEYMEENLPKVKSLLPFFADYCRVPIRSKPSVLPY
jgi:NTE family protein